MTLPPLDDYGMLVVPDDATLDWYLSLAAALEAGRATIRGAMRDAILDELHDGLADHATHVELLSLKHRDVRTIARYVQVSQQGTKDQVASRITRKVAA